jgi:hypothetical protein
MLTHCAGRVLTKQKMYDHVFQWIVPEGMQLVPERSNGVVMQGITMYLDR